MYPLHMRLRWYLVQMGESGACVLFQNPKATKNEFGSLMQRFPALDLASKTIGLEGEVRTKNVAQGAGLWLRADDADGKMLVFDNMGQATNSRHNILDEIHDSISITKQDSMAQLRHRTSRARNDVGRQLSIDGLEQTENG